VVILFWSVFFKKIKKPATVEVQLMNEDNKEAKESEKECRMNTADSQGDTNLCCCYVIEENGSYTDPCDIPAKDCC
jgi:hypothetical protein